MFYGSGGLMCPPTPRDVSEWGTLEFLRTINWSPWRARDFQCWKAVRNEFKRKQVLFNLARYMLRTKCPAVCLGILPFHFSSMACCALLWFLWLSSLCLESRAIPLLLRALSLFWGAFVSLFPCRGVGWSMLFGEGGHIIDWMWRAHSGTYLYLLGLHAD